MVEVISDRRSQVQLGNEGNWGIRVATARIKGCRAQTQRQSAAAQLHERFGDGIGEEFAAGGEDEVAA